MVTLDFPLGENLRQPHHGLYDQFRLLLTDALWRDRVLTIPDLPTQAVG